MSIIEKINAGLAAALKYGPYVHSAVQGVEAAIGSGNGATKKQLAVSAVIAAAHAGETVPVAQVQVISSLVDVVVSTLNALGVFGKATPPASIAVPPAPAQQTN